jgi:hypothetical protein
MASREVVWEVTATEWDALSEAADLLANAAISQQDYVERLRSMGMPACGPGTHVRIVLRTGRRVVSTPSAALRAGVLPGLPTPTTTH